MTPGDPSQGGEAAGTLPVDAGAALAQAAVDAVRRGRVPSPPACDPLDPRPLEPGTLFNRYIIIEVLGVGGVGIVYAAYDSDLDRKVALKLVRAAPRGSERRRARLIREAQSLARLSHPNVVPVYEVGAVAEQVFVAMEFIDGQTMREWLGSERRSWRAIIDCYVQAGRGLAAAHAADIVHRDFKPDNILVGQDGRVRVLDFGLAIPASDAAFESHGDPLLGEEAEPNAPLRRGKRPESIPNLLATPAPLTIEGRIMGTPAYMAPEQAEGGAADARADQYSFCIALWEALYGQRPQRGETLKIKRDHPGVSEVPTRVRKVLERGLDPDPDRRFVDMMSLLEALEAQPRSTPLILALLVLLAFGFAGAGVALTLRGSSEDPCTANTEALDGIWDDELRSRIGARLTASGAAFAPDTWATMADELDGWTERWLEVGVQTCEATHINHEQSTDMLDLRMACLDRQLNTLSAVTEVLASDPPTQAGPEGRPRVEGGVSRAREKQGAAALIDEALDAVLSLPDPRRCRRASLLGELDRRRPDPSKIEDITALRAQLTRAQGLLSIGQYKRARALIIEIDERSLGLDFPPLEAQIRLAQGQLLEATGEPAAAKHEFTQAWILAQSTGDDELTIEASNHLTRLHTTEAEFELAALWHDIGDASFQRIDGDLHTKIELLRAGASLSYERGDYERALEQQLEALETSETLNGEGHVEVARQLLSLAATRQRLGQWQEGRGDVERALKIIDTELGRGHPLRAKALCTFGLLVESQGKPNRALELFRAALVIYGKAYADVGGRHPELARTWNLIGIAQHSLADYDAMKAAFERSRDLYLELYGPDHARLVNVYQNLATAEAERGDVEAAIESFALAERVAIGTLGERHMSTGFIHFNTGELQWELGHYQAAETRYRRAEDIWRENVGKEHDLHAMAMGGRARALHRQGHIEEGLELQREAFNIREKALGPEHHGLAVHLLWIGVGELERDAELHPGGVDRAVVVLERGIEILDGADGASPTTLSELQFHLARARWRQPEGQAEALDLARRAHQSAQQAGAGRESILARIEAWRDEHGAAP